MRRPLQMRIQPALAAVTLAFGGCATPTPVTIKGAELAFKPISSSPRDTCSTQRQVAEHNSRLDTIKTGTPRVYKAPCDVDKAVKKEPQTS